MPSSYNAYKASGSKNVIVIQLIPSKVIALFNLGYIQEAAELGFSIYDTRDRHPKSVLMSH
jgi:hypothetical protein